MNLFIHLIFVFVQIRHVYFFRLHKQIMDIGGNKLKAVQCRVDAISNNIDQVTGQITKTKVGVKTSER